MSDGINVDKAPSSETYMDNILDKGQFEKTSASGDGVNGEGDHRSEDGVVDDREFVGFASKKYGISQERAQEIFSENSGEDQKMDLKEFRAASRELRSSKSESDGSSGSSSGFDTSEISSYMDNILSSL